MSAILTEAELSKRIPRSPRTGSSFPPPRRAQRFLTPEQVNRLADAIIPRYRVLVLVGAYLGLRWGECAGLQFADLDLRHGFALIHRTISEVCGTLHVVPTKGKPTVIPLPNFLWRELKEHIARFVGPDGSVFTSPKGGPLRHNDGTAFPPAARSFACVVVTNDLHRPIMAALVDAVMAEGVFIYETFARGNERFGKPRSPDHLLEPGELLEVVRGKLRVLAYEDLTVYEPRPAVIQRICAINEEGRSA